MPKKWHQKFDDVLLSKGFVWNQYDKFVYSKFHATGLGVILCLYIDDILIFSTNQDQVDYTKRLFSSKFLINDIGEANVILGIRSNRRTKGLLWHNHIILRKFSISLTLLIVLRCVPLLILLWNWCVILASPFHNWNTLRRLGAWCMLWQAPYLIFPMSWGDWVDILVILLLNIGIQFEEYLSILKALLITIWVT